MELGLRSSSDSSFRKEQVYTFGRAPAGTQFTLPKPYKFGHLTSVNEDLPFEYGDTWAIEKTSGPDRLVIAPRSNQVALLGELTSRMSEPFYVLYVFLVPKTDAPSGRYQSPDPVSRGDLSAFLSRFREYFECDGRHDVWVRSAHDSSLLVYDQHNIIYAYGPLEAFEETLRSKGFAKVPNIRFPVPHSHHYNEEFDHDQEALLNYWSWKTSPLTDQDQD